MDYRHHLPPQMARQPPQLSNNSSSSSSRSSLNSNMAPPPSGCWSGEAPIMQQTFKLPSDDELRCKGTEYLLKLIRKYEMDYYKLTMNHNDLQHNFMHQSKQMRILSDTNQQLMHQNRQHSEEHTRLMGLTCFVDDEKMRAQRSACEWQKFGRFCTSAMQRETSGFAEKVKILEQRQHNLMTENRTLREIIQMLDEEKNPEGPGTSALLSVATRDSGDGSSNGSTTGSSSPDHRGHTTKDRSSAHKHGSQCCLQNKYNTQEESTTKDPRLKNMLQGAEYSPIPMEIGDPVVTQQSQENIGSILTPTPNKKRPTSYPNNSCHATTQKEERVSVKEMCDTVFQRLLIDDSRKNPSMTSQLSNNVTIGRKLIKKPSVTNL